MYPGAFALTHPDKPATIMGGSGEVITYGQLDADANRLSRYFHDLGLRPGDHVAFCLENHPRFFSIAWGAHYAGLIYTAISSRLTVDETDYIINDCGAQAFITSAYKADVAAAMVDRMPNVRGRLIIDGTLDGYEPYDEVVGGYPVEPLEERVEGVDMLYSSGTTGRPKGVLPAAPESPLGAAPSAVQGLGQLLFGFADDATYLHPAPLYHAAPLRFCMAIHRCGGTVVAAEHFDAEESLALVERHQVTTSQWVPTMFVRMLKLPEATRTRYDLSTLASAVHAAAPCPIEVKERMIGWWGPILHEYYAGTEGNGLTYCSSDDWMTHKGSVGKALVGEVHIVGDDGEEVAVGDVGTVYFGSGAPFEYHNDPAKTAESRHPKGWSTLGDIGRLDDDGFLYLTDRKANMIISGGVNIYPQEAENVLTMHPKVFDVAVFGVPNEDFGEEVKAVVQPVDMSEAGADLERELISYCREHLADVKCPRSVDFEAELPRHPTGKLYKRLLRERYWDGDRLI